MNRRDVIVSATAGLGLLAAAGVVGAKPKPDKAPAPKADPRAALLAALADCQRTGELCRGHCAQELANGNKDFARCSAAIQAMLATITATATLVGLGAAQAKQLASVCQAVCKDCEDACAEHKAHFAHNMHLECRDCMNACVACAKACAAFTA